MPLAPPASAGLKVALSEGTAVQVNDESSGNCVLPEELALHLDIHPEDQVDQVAFAILCPLFCRPLPAPWQRLSQQSGRVDFYHSGLQEVRRQHPLFQFFGELLAFLRRSVHDSESMMELLAVEVFKEVNPESVKERLGFWEGPQKDPAIPGGFIFKRLWPGSDEAFPNSIERRDDPRLEAAGVIEAHLSGWHHLWQGFAPEEPFPLIPARLCALATQLSESVVVAPGRPAVAARADLESRILAVAPRDIVKNATELTRKEREAQPLVTGLLGNAYGKALTAVGTEELKIKAAARKVEEQPKVETQPTAEEEEESEEAYSSDEIEDDFEEESDDSEEESDEAETSEDSEELPLAEVDLSTGQVQQAPIPAEPATEPEAEFADAEADADAEAAAGMDSLAKEEVPNEEAEVKAPLLAEEVAAKEDTASTNALLSEAEAEGRTDKEAEAEAERESQETEQTKAEADAMEKSEIQSNGKQAALTANPLPTAVRNESEEDHVARAAQELAEIEAQVAAEVAARIAAEKEEFENLDNVEPYAFKGDASEWAERSLKPDSPRRDVSRQPSKMPTARPKPQLGSWRRPIDKTIWGESLDTLKAEDGDQEYSDTTPAGAKVDPALVTEALELQQELEEFVQGLEQSDTAFDRYLSPRGPPADEVPIRPPWIMKEFDKAEVPHPFRKRYDLNKPSMRLTMMCEDTGLNHAITGAVARAASPLNGASSVKPPYLQEAQPPPRKGAKCVPFPLQLSQRPRSSSPRAPVPAKSWALPPMKRPPATLAAALRPDSANARVYARRSRSGGHQSPGRGQPPGHAEFATAPPLLSDLAAILFHDTIQEEIHAVIHEVMAETLFEELLFPRGAASTFPEVDRWLKKMKQRREHERKQKRKKNRSSAHDGDDAEAGTEFPINSPSRSPRGAPSDQNSDDGSQSARGKRSPTSSNDTERHRERLGNRITGLEKRVVKPNQEPQSPDMTPTSPSAERKAVAEEVAATSQVPGQTAAAQAAPVTAEEAGPPATTPSPALVPPVPAAISMVATSASAAAEISQVAQPSAPLAKGAAAGVTAGKHEAATRELPEEAEAALAPTLVPSTAELAATPTPIAATAEIASPAAPASAQVAAAGVLAAAPTTETSIPSEAGVGAAPAAPIPAQFPAAAAPAAAPAVVPAPAAAPALAAATETSIPSAPAAQTPARIPAAATPAAPLAADPVPAAATQVGPSPAAETAAQAASASIVAASAAAKKASATAAERAEAPAAPRLRASFGPEVGPQEDDAPVAAQARTSISKNRQGYLASNTESLEKGYQASFQVANPESVQQGARLTLPVPVNLSALLQQAAKKNSVGKKRTSKRASDLTVSHSSSERRPNRLQGRAPGFRSGSPSYSSEGSGDAKQDATTATLDTMDWKRLLDGSSERGFRPVTKSKPPEQNRFAGFSWVDKKPSQKTLASSQSAESFLPWMPRPAEEVCRSYSHISRLLKDPTVSTTVRRRRPQQKKPLHVSVPRMPDVVRPATGSEQGSGDGADMFEEVSSRPALRGFAKSGMQGSKSAPNLMNTSGVSTAAPATSDTWWQGSGQSSVEESTAYDSTFLDEDSRSFFNSSISSLPPVAAPAKGRNRQRPTMSKTSTAASPSFPPARVSLRSA